jgi:hypothetical protein
MNGLEQIASKQRLIKTGNHSRTKLGWQELKLSAGLLVDK